MKLQRKIEGSIRYKSDPDGNLVNVTAFSFSKSEYIKTFLNKDNTDDYHILFQDTTLGNNELMNQAIDCFKKQCQWSILATSGNLW